MSRSDPPSLATWLMSTLGGGAHTESLIGDLLEQYRQGRSSAWYWRQALRAIAASAARDLREHALLTLWIASLGASIEPLFTRSPIPGWIYRINRLWNPAVIDSRWSWIVLNPWAYRLQLYSLPTRVVWCVMLALASWTISRLYSRNRGLAVAVFLVSQVILFVPYLGRAVADWLHEPTNPMWFFNALWFALFVLAAVPSSILVGGLCHSTADP